MSEKLLPCAHCGRSAVLREFDSEFWGKVCWVECLDCDIALQKQYSWDDREDAIAAWNKRTVANNARVEGGWISVKDRLPEDGRTVLVHGGVARYKEGGWYTGMELPLYKRQIEWKVTHWMPLPEPPEEIE